MSYRDLKSYQTATIVYDFTVEFCDIYVENRTDPPVGEASKPHKPYRFYSRMSDQMIQAARSGKQNIVEASTERTSKKGELKLLGISRASFQELLEDYEDFLRQRSLSLWGKDHPKAREIRALAYRTDKTYKTYQTYLSDSAVAANVAICLINQVNFLLDRQIKSLEEKFVKGGGWSENIYKKREQMKKRQRSPLADNW